MMKRKTMAKRRTRRRYPRFHKIYIYVYMYETYEDREIIINSKNNMNTKCKNSYYLRVKE